METYKRTTINFADFNTTYECFECYVLCLSDNQVRRVTVFDWIPPIVFGSLLPQDLVVANKLTDMSKSNRSRNGKVDSKARKRKIRREHIGFPTSTMKAF